MSAPRPCNKCRYHWNHKDEDGYNPCYRCSLYDQENEIYLDFENFFSATNEDRVKNMMYMPADELAILLNELCPHKTTYDWYQWLNERIG